MTPVIAYVTYEVGLQIASFDVAAPIMLDGTALPCDSRWTESRVRGDGQHVRVAAPCFDQTTLTDTLHFMTMTPGGGLVHVPLAVQHAMEYGGTAATIATSPTGPLAVTFTEFDSLAMAHRGFVAFLAVTP